MAVRYAFVAVLFVCVLPVRRVQAVERQRVVIVVVGFELGQTVFEQRLVVVFETVV